MPYVYAVEALTLVVDPEVLNLISKEGALVTSGALVIIRLHTLGTIATSEQTSNY